MKDKHDKVTVDMFELSDKHRNCDECSCLDAAYERMAVNEGLNRNPVFPENEAYMKAQKCIN